MSYVVVPDEQSGETWNVLHRSTIYRHEDAREAALLRDVASEQDAKDAAVLLTHADGLRSEG